MAACPSGLLEVKRRAYVGSPIFRYVIEILEDKVVIP